MSIELDLLVPSPGGLNPDALPFVPQGFKPGVRVVNLSLRVGESAMHAMHAYVPIKTCTKASEHARKPVKSGRCLVTATASWCTSLEYGVLSVHFAGHANVYYKLDTLATMVDVS